MFLSRNKKNNVYHCKPQFYYIKWGIRGSKLYRRVFVMSFIFYCVCSPSWCGVFPLARDVTFSLCSVILSLLRQFLYYLVDKHLCEVS